MGYSITVYQWEIASYKDKIYKLQMEVRNYKNYYESLRVFKKTVENSQQSFNNINSSKKSILQDIATVKKNNRAAAKYYTGLSNVLDGTGSKVISLAYNGLIRQITNKLTEYMSKINNCNRQIVFYEKKITELNYRIYEIRMKEEER